MAGLIRSKSLSSNDSGLLYCVGPGRLLGGVKAIAVVVVGEDGYRCSIFTAAEHEDVHRKLCQGAGNLVSSAPKSGRVPFTEETILDEFSRRLPRGIRLARPRPVELRDVHGTGRILFDAAVGGLALDDDFELRRRPQAAPVKNLNPSFG